MNCIDVGGGKGRRRGLTLIEMMIVFVIVGILAAIALPKFDLNRFRADSAGRMARVLLQEAQRNAITRQSNVIVSFDPSGGRFRVVQDYNNNDTINTADWVQYRKLPDGATFAVPSWSGAIGADGTAAGAGISGTSLITVSGLQSIVFLRSGSASTDLRLFVTMRAGDPTSYREVIVTASTGRSDLYKFNGTTWVRQTQ